MFFIGCHEMQVLKEKIKEKIIEAAINDFVEKGFDQALMRTIAKNAGISVSNLYNYFKNKKDLFYSISDPFYYHLKNLLNHFFEHDANEDYKNKQFLTQFAGLTAKALGELIKINRNEFLLIMDRSEGTKYEKYKNRVILILEEHFQEHLKLAKKKKQDFVKDSFIMHIIAKNLIESLLEIARHYKNDEWVDYNINTLMKYHLSGISQFF